MLFMCDDGESDTIAVADSAPTAWLERMAEQGVAHEGGRLQPRAQAVTVRVRDGKLLVTDGPFAETKEQICGFEIVTCADLDEALEVAGSHPSAARHTVEIRPFWED